MSSIKKTLLALTAGTILVAGTAMAMGGHGGPGGGHGGKGECAEGDKLERMSQKLNLTDEQRTQISTIMEQYKTDFDPEAHKAEREAHRAAMQSMMQSEDFDEQSAREFMQSMQAQRVDKQVERMKMQHEILAVLTPEQQAQLEQMRGRGMRGERGEHGYRGHGPEHDDYEHRKGYREYR
jgi:Spy/CpxP family protein refolding chaperone